MNIRKVFVAIIIFSNSHIAFAQVPASLQVALITQSTGLSVAYNHFVYKDSENFTWISSTHGLHRYDGKNIELYLPRPGDEASIRGLIVNGYFFEDAQKNIWFSTYEAVNCYERSKNQFSSFSDPDNPNPGYFTCGLDTLGQLWMLHGDDLVTFDIQQHRFSKKAEVKAGVIRAEIKLSNEGQVERVYVYDNEGSNPGFQVLTFNNSQLQNTINFFDADKDQPLTIRDIWIEDDSDIWIASKTGLFNLNMTSGNWNKFTPYPEKEFVYFNALEQYNDSLIFITSYGLGEFIFNKQKQKFVEHFQLVNEGNEIYGTPQALYKDKDGGIWISLYSTGVAYFHPANPFFRNYKHNLGTSLLPNSKLNPNSILELKDHSVWVGSRLQGAVLMNDAESILKKYNIDETKNWIANNSIMSLLDHQDRIWILSLRGPMIRNPDGQILQLDPEEKYSSISICETNKGDIILGHANGGLYRCIELPQSHFSFSKIIQVDSTKAYTILFAHHDGLIYGTADLTTLDVYDPANDFNLLQSLDFKTDAQCIVSLPRTEDIWIGTDYGLFVYSQSTKSLIIPEWLKELSTLIIYSIVPENHRYTWLSSNQGIYRLDHEQKSIQSYALNSGTGSYNFIRNVGMHRSNGEIWFGTIDGITVINASQDHKPIKLSPVNFTNLLINDIPATGITCQETGSKNIIEFKNIRLPYDQNTITLQFNALNYSGPDQTNYEYRMMGLHEAWVNNNQRDMVRFANLPPGNYTFEVRAVSGYPGSESEVRSLKIGIIAPFYLRNWFIAVVIIISATIFALIYLWFQRRKAHLQKLEFEKRLALETERLRIASDMHDDLGSGISALSLRTKFLSEHVDGPQLQKQLHELVSQTNSLSQQIRETIWTINSKNDIVDNLVTKLHQYTLEYFEGSGIQCEVNLMPEQVMTSIPGNHRREIYLAFKEALHNIQKHSHATEISIDMFIDGTNHLIIQIRDNGRGFDLQQEHSGLGIASMKNRMETVGGQFRISTGESGTLIKLSYPV